MDEGLKTPILSIEKGWTKDHIQFSVYNFLIRDFDKAFVGYPVLFIFPNERDGRTKVYMSASEVGARVADFIEARPGSSAIVSIERDGTLVQVIFSNPDTKEVDLRILELPVIGSC